MLTVNRTRAVCYSEGRRLKAVDVGFKLATPDDTPSKANYHQFDKQQTNANHVHVGRFV